MDQLLTNASSDRKSEDIFGFTGLDNLLETFIRITNGVEMKGLACEIWNTYGGSFLWMRQVIYVRWKGIIRNDRLKINEFDFEGVWFQSIETILIDFNLIFLKKSTLCLINAIFPPIIKSNPDFGSDIFHWVLTTLICSVFLMLFIVLKSLDTIFSLNTHPTKMIFFRKLTEWLIHKPT